MKNKNFSKELRTTIQEVIKEEIQSLKTTQPTWMRSSQVRTMLHVSDSTLQTLRVNRTIPAYKLGTTWFYKYDEIVSVLEASKINGKEVDHE